MPPSTEKHVPTNTQSSMVLEYSLTECTLVTITGSRLGSYTCSELWYAIGFVLWSLWSMVWFNKEGINQLTLQWSIYHALCQQIWKRNTLCPKNSSNIREDEGLHTKLNGVLYSTITWWLGLGMSLLRGRDQLTLQWSIYHALCQQIWKRNTLCPKNSSNIREDEGLHTKLNGVLYSTITWWLGLGMSLLQGRVKKSLQPSFFSSHGCIYTKVAVSTSSINLCLLCHVTWTVLHAWLHYGISIKTMHFGHY